MTLPPDAAAPDPEVEALLTEAAKWKGYFGPNDVENSAYKLVTRLATALAASRHAPATRQAEGAWIIRDDGGRGEHYFRTLKQGQPAWTVDQNEALQFARREDAERYAEEDEDAWSIFQIPAPASEEQAKGGQGALTFAAFRAANAARCIKWHPAGIASWSPSDWGIAVTGEVGELMSLVKMLNRERDGLVGNKFSPTTKQIADECADIVTYVDLFAERMGIDLGRAIAEKFNEVSQRNGFKDRL